MRLRFHTYDVFTSERYAGNPLAVVSDGDGLDGARMQELAREFNLSETVFLLKPADPRHTARLRIFTPKQELPFAGHPTIGTACHLVAMTDVAGTGGSGATIVTLEEEIGPVRVGVRREEGGALFAEFDAPKLPERFDLDVSTARLANAFGLPPDAIGYAGHWPSVWSAGVAFLFVPLAGRGALREARLAAGALPELVGNDRPIGVYLYCAGEGCGGAEFDVRMLAPDMGIAEDPATGAAAVAFAGLVANVERPIDGLHRVLIRQGEDMGRPSRILLELDMRDGALARVRIGGHAVRVSEGTIEA